MSQQNVQKIRYTWALEISEDKSKLKMVISFVKKYTRDLSLSCRVGDLSLSFSCRVGEYFFVCQFLSASWLSVSCLSVSCRTTCQAALTKSLSINRLFPYCKGGNFNIHIWAWFGYFFC